MQPRLHRKSAAPPGGDQGAETAAARIRLRHLRHEARTPVNHIIGYCELLLEEMEGRDQPDLLAGLQWMHAAGKRLLAVITEGLDPARFEAGTLNLPGLREQVYPPAGGIISSSLALQDVAREHGQDPPRFAADPCRRGGAAVGSRRGCICGATRAGGVRRERVVPHRRLRPPAINGGIRPLGERRAFAQGTDHGSLLIVDDNELNRDMLSRRLERLGYLVTCAESGRRALELVDAQPFDLMLLDIMMPDMNGYQVLEQLYGGTHGRHIPVIVLSALDEIDSVVRCIEMGAEDYLAKPFDPVLLQARIGALLEKKRLRDQEVLYLQQVARVTAAAAAVEAVTYDSASLEEVAARTDALGQLARVFQRMAREVYAREQRLKEQVRDLKIEIDQARKAREVAEITETEYFQQLSARPMRCGARRRSDRHSQARLSCTLVRGGCA